jgi:hypothetical protein
VEYDLVHPKVVLGGGKPVKDERHPYAGTEQGHLHVMGSLPVSLPTVAPEQGP